jgi:hypothetical protein
MLPVSLDCFVCLCPVPCVLNVASVSWLFSLSLPCALCPQCCQCLWIIQFVFDTGNIEDTRHRAKTNLTIQRHWQHWGHKAQDKDKLNNPDTLATLRTQGTGLPVSLDCSVCLCPVPCVLNVVSVSGFLSYYQTSYIVQRLLNGRKRGKLKDIFKAHSVNITTISLFFLLL